MRLIYTKQSAKQQKKHKISRESLRSCKFLLENQESVLSGIVYVIRHFQLSDKA